MLNNCLDKSGDYMEHMIAKDMCYDFFTQFFNKNILKNYCICIFTLWMSLYSYRFSYRVQCYCIEVDASRADALLHKFDNLCLVLCCHMGYELHWNLMLQKYTIHNERLTEQIFHNMSISEFFNNSDI
jgi:hypothetical protein